MSLGKDLLNLMFPRSCAGCSTELAENELSVCTECLLALPRTHYWEKNENPVSKIFWGRVKIENAATFYHFHKGGRLQEMMHNFKYKKMKEIGRELGVLFGHHLLQSSFNEAEIIIPIPLHEKKLKQRGYNQSEEIANGISEILKIDVDTKSVTRTVANATQTQKGRFDRWANVENIFEINNRITLENKHILLVDDVLTTGATLEACAMKILEVAGTKVSIAALASAEM